jgi:hypothetical protein
LLVQDGETRLPGAKEEGAEEALLGVGQDLHPSLAWVVEGGTQLAHRPLQLGERAGDHRPLVGLALPPAKRAPEDLAASARTNLAAGLKLGGVTTAGDAGYLVAREDRRGVLVEVAVEP